MRALWSGEYVSHHGQHYLSRTTNLHSHRAPTADLCLRFGPKSAERRGVSGMATFDPAHRSCCSVSAITVAKEACAGRLQGLLEQRREGGGRDRPPVMGDVGLARRAVQQLRSPRHFEQVSALVTEPMTAEAVACGPDVDRHVRAFHRSPRRASTRCTWRKSAARKSHRGARTSSRPMRTKSFRSCDPWLANTPGKTRGRFWSGCRASAHPCRRDR